MDKTNESINSMHQEIENPDTGKMITDNWERLKSQYYNSNTILTTEWGTIDFDPKALETIVGGDELSYDEYLEILKSSALKSRTYLEMCYYFACYATFKGEIEKIKPGHICFKRISISGLYSDGTGFDGREDHLWISSEGFEEFKVGDSVSFEGEVYRYLKKGNGKAIDYSIRRPYNIKKTGEYSQPSDNDLRLQAIDSLICEICPLNEHCTFFCLSEIWHDEMRKALMPDNE